MENTQTTTTLQNTTETTTQQQSTQTQTKAEGTTLDALESTELFKKLDDIIEKRSQGIIKSVLKDNGIEDSDIGEIVAKYKEAKKAGKEKSVNDMQSLKAKNSALESELLNIKLNNNAATIATEIGLDTKKLTYAMKMADLNGVVNDGAIDSAKLKDALTKVLTDIPEFKSTNENQGIRKIGAETKEPETIDAISKWRKAMGINTENK